MNNKEITKLVAPVIGGVIILGGIIFGSMSIKNVKPGYVGVVYTPSSGVTSQTLSQGWHFISPLKKVTQFSIATEQAYMSKDDKEGSGDNESFGVPTKDGKMVDVDLEFSYKFDHDKVDELFVRFRGQSGKTIEQSYIRGKMKAWVSEVTSQFTVLDVYGEKRAELNKQAFEHVKEKFEEDGIIIESLNFSRIGLDAATETAIQERVNAQQQLEKEKIEVEKAQLEAERKKVEAEGEAEKKKIEAAAQAEANKMLEENLTTEMIQKMWIEKWDGKLPQVSGSDNVMVGLPSEKAE